MNHLIGRSGDLALYANNTHGVVINTALGVVVASGSALDIYASDKWELSSTQLTKSETVLADKILANLQEEAIIASADRMYTIPKSVQIEAEKSLEWHKEHNRGGTPVGLNTAHTLAKGGQIGIRKIRHIAKYFPRHEVDKKGKGWKPSEDNFPSNGRIAWALWGGDAGWRWAKAIVEREDKKPVAAGGYTISDYSDQINYAKDNEKLNPFKYANELDPNYGPEFIARVGLDGSGIDRLYMVDIDGTVFVWDDGEWDNLGSVDGDIWTYDRMLDDIYDVEEKSHVIIDPKSALIIAARLAVDPYCKTSVYDIDSDEAALMQDGIDSEDWDFVDQVITAASTPSNKDGNYTPEERSQNAGNQPRDMTGQFAKKGQKVAIGGDASRGSGVIQDINGSTGIVTVKLDDGRTVKVGSKYLAPAEKATNTAPAQADAPAPTMDFSGIIGEPKTPASKEKARLPRELPKLDVDKFLSGYASWVEKERYNATNPSNKTAPVTAAAEEKTLTPKTSDVTPRYLAIVSQDDPSAVMDLVAIVPKTATSTEPIVYKRDGDKWVQDDQTLADLKSATKPPVVELDKESLNDVLMQMSESKPTAPKPAEAVAASLLTVLDAFVAAGGLDRNRGNAEKLRRYWTRGEGAAKIRWGTPGDWKRCVKHLAKYLGPRAKGYCQLRHKDALGYYTATHAKRDRQNG